MTCMLSMKRQEAVSLATASCELHTGLSLSAGTELNDCTVSFGFLSQCPAVIAEKLNAKQLDKAMAELDKNGKYGCEPSLRSSAWNERMPVLQHTRSR